ncbi:hypothetical protein PoB_003370800 [Plakobranchus ocellatus]|uniref:Uncharacterized protein n=1 Tax=Plakobranchus ocellatus TaxID=259542 RepID=A0AAV4AK89_9GAST|nr:hypothetical protein PoB_003370800 [Plakobranchus ocellatus]
MFGRICRLMVNKFPNFMTPTGQKIIYRVYTGATQCKFFVEERGTRSSCPTERDTVSLPLLCVVCAGNRKKRFCMFCPNVGKWQVTTEWASKSLGNILWRQDRVAMSTAAKIMRKFLR